MAASSTAPLRTARLAAGARSHDSNLVADDANWDTSQGCQYSNGGLYAASGAICLFVPSGSQDLTSQGFLLRVTIAPAAETGDNPAAFIDLGENIFVGVSQMGQYAFCDSLDNCDLTLGASTIDWHADPYVTNTMAVKYDPQASQLILYLNGIQVDSVKATISPNTSIAVAAPAGAEALFTHATLYSASG